MEIKKYPKLLYKTRDVYKRAEDEEEHQKLALLGWKDHWITDVTPVQEVTKPAATSNISVEIKEAVFDNELDLPIRERYRNILKGLELTEEKLEKMTLKELIAINGIGKSVANQIWEYFHGNSA
jgi:hypothetical protein